LKTIRPLNPRELAKLEKDLRQGETILKSQKRFFLGWTLLAVLVGSFVYFRLDSKAELYLLMGTVITYIFIGVWVFLEQFSKTNKRRTSIEFAKAKNEITSIRVNSRKYIELSEVEDEGVFYLFQLENNRILSFGGQDFYPTKKFPSDSFEIAVLYGVKDEIVLLEKYLSGNKLEPLFKITGQEKWDLLAKSGYPDPERFTMIEGILEDYRN